MMYEFIFAFRAETRLGPIYNKSELATQKLI